MNDITPRTLEELTLGDVIHHYSEQFQIKNNITIGKPIPVLDEKDLHRMKLGIPTADECVIIMRDLENEWGQDARS